jgi:Tfp pilus assembly protein PilF
MLLAKAAAQKAVELDDNLAEAHCSLATIKFQHDYDWVGSELEFRRALELNPSYALAHSQYGFSLALQRRFDDGLVEIERGHQLDPLSVQNTILLADLLAWKGDFNAAREQLRRHSI